MKPVRLFLYFLAGLLALLVVAVGVAFTSGFQTWAARKAIAGQPALHASVGRVSAGLHQVEVTALRAEPDGAVLTVPSLIAQLPLISAGLSQKVTITKLVAKGWTLDLTKTQPPASSPAAPAPKKTAAAGGLVSSANAADVAVAATAAAFHGVFSQLQLPVDLSVDGVELEGDVLLPPTPDAPAARAHVRLAGGGLGAGREGRFTVDLAIAFSGEKIPVNSLTARTTVLAAMDTPRTFTRIESETTAAAKGEKFPGGVNLVATLGATRAALLENYTAVLVLEGKEVVAIRAEFPRDANVLTGTWKLNARGADLAPFALGRTLPEIEAQGEGKFSSDAAFSEVHASGRLDATAARLGMIQPELAALGTVKLAAEFDLSQHGRALRVDRLTAQFTGAAPVAQMQALQPFEFNLETGELKVAEPARELLSLNLQAVPLAWVQPFVKTLTLTGGDVRGELVATASNGGLALRAKTPLSFTGVSIATADGPQVRAIDGSVNFTADYTPQGWQAEVTTLTLASGGTTLFSLNGKAGQLAGKDQLLKATGRWTANLAALLLQPAAAGKAGLVQGEASGDFTAAIGARQEIRATLALQRLAADPKLTKESLPTIAIDLRADIDAAGKINFNAPVLFERNGQKSDLALVGSAMSGPKSTVLDVRVTSTLLVLEDVQILGALAPGEPPAETPVPPKSKPDEKPFWSGFSGQFALALKKVIYAGKFEINDVGGTVVLEEGALKFDGVKAGFNGDSTLKFNGGVTFAPQVRDPYALKAEFALANFDSAPLFRALDPSRLPAVEGRFNVISHLAGNGGNAAQLMQRTRGDFELSSKTGLFRGLSADMAESLKQAPSMLSAAVGSVGTLLGLKKEKIDDANEYLDKQGKVVVEIADRLKEIAYDQINVVAARDEALNIRLKEFSLIAPEIRLRGRGEISYRESVPLLAQPLDLRIQLGARGRLENLMNNVALLDKGQDELGYTNLIETIRLGGTLENIDKSALKKLLTEAAVKKARSSLLDNLNGLLGR